MTKTIDPPNPKIGDPVTYVVTLTNNGPDTATGIKVNETPPNVLSATFLPAAGTQYDVNNHKWSIPLLANGASTTLTIIGNAAASGDYTNTAEITESESPDPDPSNNVATVPAMVPPTADLSIDKQLVGGPAFFAGATVEFNVVLTNDGPDEATNVTIADAIPAGAGGSPTVTPTTGTYAAGVWTVASIASGATATLHVVGTATGIGTYTNTAEITASDQVDSDSTPGDHVPEQDDQSSVDFQVVPTTADLAVTKVADKATLVVGDVVTFTIEVTNNGPDDATNVEIAEALGPNFSNDSIVVETLGTYASSIDTWFIDKLTVGSTATLTIEALTVLDGAVTNTASVQALDQNDPDPSNDSQSVDITIDPFVSNPALELTKSAATADTNGNTITGDPGDTITYTFSVQNTGTVALTNVTVTDPLLPTLSCVIASLAVGATSSCTATNNTYVIQATDLPGPKVNTATATGTPPGTLTPPTDDHTVSTPLAPAPVASIVLTKAGSTADTNGNTTVGDPGDTITYSFSVQNTGTVTLTSVTVSDPLLTGLVSYPDRHVGARGNRLNQLCRKHVCDQGR